MKRIQKFRLIIILLITGMLIFACMNNREAKAEMPFYDLKPKDIVFRNSFYTSYPSSSSERKYNIRLASKSINNTFIDVGEEFSFNRVVGRRTESRGYKSAKIIVNGKFVEGVGGGVCQVSTTLYNAVLLSGLKITECHAHSLPVSYIAPSFDAMVNSGSADLRFINNTHNPIIIKSYADDSIIKFEIYGEPMLEKYCRESVSIEEISAPAEQVVLDEKGEYEDLYEGEKKVVSYSKKGLKSKGILIKSVGGRIVKTMVIRNDIYKAQQGLIVIGTKEKKENNEIKENLI